MCFFAIIVNGTMKMEIPMPHKGFGYVFFVPPIKRVTTQATNEFKYEHLLKIHLLQKIDCIEIIP